MHVGIDNATNGHGAKACEAVELYLDQIFKEGGEDARQAEWRAFGIPARREDDIQELIQRKAHYGSLNHLAKRLGDHRINDLFAKPDVLVAELASSPWVVAGKPDESRLLNYLTTFNGPMYKVFNQEDLKLWRRWIEWLGCEGDTSSPKQFIGKADAMLVVLSELRELAKASQGHRRYRLTVTDDESATVTRSNAVAELFERGDLTELMRALRDPQNGWIVQFDAGASRFMLVLVRGTNSMCRFVVR